MYRKKRIALVIPARNEEKLIKPTLLTTPKFVDRIYVVDDGSTDNMARVVKAIQKKQKRVTLIQNKKNVGPGGAIIVGYKQAYKDKYDITVVVGGDNQMPMEQMTRFLDPLIDNKADYAKGNRFLVEGNVYESMPLIRQFGNMIISLLTKLASGLYKIYDVVDGYTAITREAIGLINWDKAWPKYGYPMDFLIRCNAYGLRVLDIPRRAIYLPGEKQSQIKGLNYTIRVSPMLLRGFFWRLFKKYLIRDFHPLIFFYLMGIIFLPVGLIWGGVLVYFKITGINISGPKAVLDAIFILLGFQSILFAILFDMQNENNR
ncbi:MAG: glycosyltransferase family 2 protein [Spirochaetes bacterium]|nr:glycosyltransferase family 2 protein [Spirochaetota bacterium]